MCRTILVVVVLVTLHGAGHVAGTAPGVALQRLWLRNGPDAGRDQVRIDINVDQWWRGYFQQTVSVPTATVAEVWDGTNVSCCWVPSGWALPVDLFISIGNIEYYSSARTGMEYCDN